MHVVVVVADKPGTILPRSVSVLVSDGRRDRRTERETDGETDEQTLHDGIGHACVYIWQIFSG